MLFEAVNESYNLQNTLMESVSIEEIVTEGLMDIAKNIWNSITKFVQKIVDGIIAFLKTCVKKIKSLFGINDKGEPVTQTSNSTTTDEAPAAAASNQAEEKGPEVEPAKEEPKEKPQAKETPAPEPEVKEAPAAAPQAEEKPKVDWKAYKQKKAEKAANTPEPAQPQAAPKAKPKAKYFNNKGQKKAGYMKKEDQAFPIETLKKITSSISISAKVPTFLAEGGTIRGNMDNQSFSDLLHAINNHLLSYLSADGYLKTLRDGLQGKDNFSKDAKIETLIDRFDNGDETCVKDIVAAYSDRSDGIFKVNETVPFNVAESIYNKYKNSAEVKIHAVGAAIKAELEKSIAQMEKFNKEKQSRHANDSDNFVPSPFQFRVTRNKLAGAENAVQAKMTGEISQGLSATYLKLVNFMSTCYIDICKAVIKTSEVIAKKA